MITRMADSLGWDVPRVDSFTARAEPMLAGATRSTAVDEPILKF